MLSKSESEKYNIFNNNLECLTTAIVSKNLDDLQIGLIQSFSENNNSNNVHDNVQNGIISFSINENNSQSNENSFQSKREDEINIENFFYFKRNLLMKYLKIITLIYIFQEKIAKIKHQKFILLNLMIT